MTPIESTRGGSLVPSPRKGDGGGDRAQEVRQIEWTDRLPGVGDGQSVGVTRSARRLQEEENE